MSRIFFLSRLQLRKWYKIGYVFMLGIALAACIGGKPPTPLAAALSEKDFVGKWEARYKLHHDGTDVLVLHDDGTFQQFYEDTRGYSYVSDVGEWYLDRSLPKILYVHFKGGRWFPMGSEIALLNGTDAMFPSQTHDFYDYKSNSSRIMVDELILIVSEAGNDKGFALYHLAYEIDDVQVEGFYPVNP